ncbi:MAG: YicC family protein [Sedimentisphaerales bacterium]|nr:YicC family protein [Sedimentisphaerales bacterium]
MIKSMTGYGQAQGDFNGFSYAVEIKSVNNRYLKISVKLPDLLSFLEDDIEKLLRNNLSRGTVNFVLRLKDISGNSLFEIDEKALQAIAEKLNKAVLATGIKGTFDISNLLNLPGIVRPISPDNKEINIIKEKVLKVSNLAMEQLKEMRTIEGNFLEADLKKHCDAIENDLQKINEKSPIVIHEYAKKLRQRADMLLAEAKLKLDEETLAREVAIFADRSDISEEIARLDSHVKQFQQFCQTNEQAGRRLDFISQEMLREANTIASKSSNGEITACVVDIKCLIERIKEQIQNIE